MNWKEIKKHHPKAMEKVIDECRILFEPTNDDNIYNYHINHVRALYDFFDENDIYISIEVDHPIVNSNIIWFNVEIPLNDYQAPGWKTRREAEKYAFTKAFEILEEKL